MLLLEVAFKTPCPWRSYLSGEIKMLSCRPWGEQGASVLVRVSGEISEFRGRGISIGPVVRLRDGYSIAMVKTSACPCRLSGLGEAHIISTRIEKGLIRARIVCENREEVRSILTRMRSSGISVAWARLRRIRDEDFLTPRQEKILVLGLIKGYFDSPRKAGLAELSEELKISKPSAYALLKRAVKKLARQAVL